MLTICTHVTRFSRVLAVAERFDDVFCTVGVHPHEAAHEPEVTVERLVDFAQHPKVVGFGETGLDFYYEHSSRDVQTKSFRTHIAAARETGLPLVVHTRHADQETAAVLAEEHAVGPFTGVLHCFSAGMQLAEKALGLGFYISFSGIMTFKKADYLRRIAAAIPLNRILVETDAPYLAPVPRRGERNEPAFIVYTAEEVGRVAGVETLAFQQATTENFFRLFGKARRA
jgi:TatD DNase family protein